MFVFSVYRLVCLRRHNISTMYPLAPAPHRGVLVQYDPAALRLAEILYDKILDMEINPLQRMGHTATMEQSFYVKADDKQLVFQPPGEREMYQHIHGRIFLRAPDSLTHLKDVDPQKIGKVLVARKPLRDILDRREEEGRYSRTPCTLPMEEYSKTPSEPTDFWCQ